MAPQKNLTSEEIEKVRIIQEIIICDSHIQRMFHDGLYQSNECIKMIHKKLDLEFQLEQLSQDEL